MDTVTKVKEIMGEILGIAPCDIPLDAGIGDLKNWDSLHHLKIIARLEETFGFKMTSEVLLDIEDVNDIIKAVDARRQ